MILPTNRDGEDNEGSLLKNNKSNKKIFRKISKEYKYKGTFKETDNEEDYDDIFLKSGITLKKIEEYKKAKERNDLNEEQTDEEITVVSLLEDLGNACILTCEKIFRGPKRACVFTVKFISALFRILGLSISKGINSLTNNFVNQSKLLFKDLKKIKKYFSLCIENEGSTLKLLFKYISGGFKRHKGFFKTVLNTSLPVMALLAFAFTVNYWGTVTFALEVNYNDKNIGYISDEKVYEQAKAQVEDRMSTGKSRALDIEEPKYELSLVPLNKLVDSEILCDRIIENSQDDLVTACGIYIDDEFLGAVKNETDARSVFNKILEPYEKDLKDENSFVDFVEKVEYVQGLYPNDSDIIWDASKLIDTLSQTKQEAVKYTVKDGDTIYDIALKNDISVDELLALNPDKAESLFPGDTLILSKQVNYIRVKVMKTQTRKIAVDFETEKINNTSIFKGTKKTIRKGEKGEDTVKELVTYIDGVRVSSQELERERTKEPVSEKIEVGSRPTTVVGMGGNITISNKGFVWPAPACRSISSPFGWRILGSNSNFHTGVDLFKAGPRGASKGAVIVASLDGTVESVKRGTTGYGNSVVIDHGNGLKTRYAHCLEGSISVSVGQHVRAGQAIARVGKTGMATGYHLHFEIIVNGEFVNPLPYIK